jgi:hypothetical protein
MRHAYHLAILAGLLPGASALAAPAPFGIRERVTAVLQVVPPAAQPARDTERFVATQAALLRSPSVLRAALRRPEVARLASVKRQSDPIRWLAGQLVLRQVPGARKVRIGLGGCPPDEAVVVLGAVIAEGAEEALGPQGRVMRAQVEVARARLLRIRELMAARAVAGGRPAILERYESEVARLEKAYRESQTIRVVQPARAVR